MPPTIARFSKARSRERLAGKGYRNWIFHNTFHARPRAKTRRLLPKKKPRFAGPLQSPLTDSNRRPPPYHGGCGQQLCDAEKALGKALSLQFTAFFACGTISSS